MPLSLKTKQVAGVTAIVGITVLLLSGWYLSSLAHVLFRESGARAEMISKAIYQRLSGVIAAGFDPADPYAGIQSDAGLRSILEAGVYSGVVTYAAIVDKQGRIVAHNDVSMVGQKLSPVDDLAMVLEQGPIAQTRAIYAKGGKTLEVRQALLLGADEFGSIHVGLSTLLIRDQFEEVLTTPLITAALALVGAIVVAVLLAQIVLRPIHVIRSGLARLGRGELDVKVDLPHEGELAGLDESFRALTARLAADRSELAEQKATLGSVVEHLEDAVALFASDGTLLFANAAIRPVLTGDQGTVAELLPHGHPYRTAVEHSLTTGKSHGPQTTNVPGRGDRLILTHLVEDAARHPLGVMLVSRNVGYLTHVESTLSYSRKLAAFSRLSAGIAHEIKNPLNATMIHLELLRMRLADMPEATEHLAVIAAQVRRLDEVVQGFLKFTRPEEMRLEPVKLADLIDALTPVLMAEAGKSRVDVRLDVPPDLPPANADPGMLQQAFLNLALNACQAMPEGGRLRIAARARPNRQLEIFFEDTGVGIAPDHLSRIFDLYFTTKDQGSGIGLSLVYRTIQLHDGDVEVQSVPGRGTTFRVTLRQATQIMTPAVAVPAS